jgi:hypothetical protein
VVKRIVTFIAIGAVLVALPASASAGKSKQVIFDKATGECGKGITGGTPTAGFALITVKAGTVKVKITAKGLRPNTTYQVDVVQTPSGESCALSPGETSLKTNSKGIGKVSYSEPVIAGQTGVFIQLLQGEIPDVLATHTVPLS